MNIKFCFLQKDILLCVIKLEISCFHLEATGKNCNFCVCNLGSQNYGFAVHDQLKLNSIHTATVINFPCLWLRKRISKIASLHSTQYVMISGECLFCLGLRDCETWEILMDEEKYTNKGMCNKSSGHQLTWQLLRAKWCICDHRFWYCYNGGGRRQGYRNSHRSVARLTCYFTCTRNQI